MATAQFFTLPANLPRDKAHIQGAMHGLALKVLRGDGKVTPKELPYYFTKAQDIKRGHIMDREQEDIQHSIENFAKAIVSSLKKGNELPADPFDSYVEGMKEKVQKGKLPFEERLTHGYQVLLKEIEENKERKNESV